MAFQEYEVAAEVGELVADAVKGRDVVLIASSDFTHVGPQYLQLPPRGMSAPEFAKEQDSRARIISIAFESCSFANSGADMPRGGSWRYCGPTWVKSDDAIRTTSRPFTASATSSPTSAATSYSWKAMQIGTNETASWRDCRKGSWTSMLCSSRWARMSSSRGGFDKAACRSTSTVALPRGVCQSCFVRANGAPWPWWFGPRMTNERGQPSAARAAKLCAATGPEYM